MAYKKQKNEQTTENYITNIESFNLFFWHWFQILWRQRGWIQEMSQGLAQWVGVKQQNPVKDNSLYMYVTTRKLKVWPIGKVLHL